jgi:hypothetical protein
LGQRFAELARRRLKTLLQGLESSGESGAAASLREGMEETLTVLKLELPPAPRGFLVTTNAIENLLGSARRTSRNVTRWRSGDMISRWAAIGLLQAEEHFRRIRGYRHLPLLKRAWRGDLSKLDATERLRRNANCRCCRQIQPRAGHYPRLVSSPRSIRSASNARTGVVRNFVCEQLCASS